MRKIWKPTVRQKAEIDMIIKGKILSAVRLNDIGKTVELGKEVSLTEYEVNKSRDLQNAINRGWVEIVYDRAMLKRAIAVQGQLKDKTEEIDVLGMAKDMARSMAEEMIKNSPLVKEIAKELAKEMVSEIKDNIKVEQIIVPQASEKKIELDSKLKLDSPDNIFVEFDDKDSGITANINKSGTVKVQKDDLTSSLERMKRFKQEKKAQQ